MAWIDLEKWNENKDVDSTQWAAGPQNDTEETYMTDCQGSASKSKVPGIRKITLPPGSPSQSLDLKKYYGKIDKKNTQV